MTLSAETIREKGIKLKGMSRRVLEPEILAALAPYVGKVFLVDGHGPCVLSEAGHVGWISLDDNNLYQATLAYMAACGFPSFSTEEEAVATMSSGAGGYVKLMPGES